MATLNIRGLRSFGKRQEIEAWMRSEKIDVMCLQETKDTETSIQKRKYFTWY